MSVTHKASSRLCVKLIQFDFIMGFNLRLLLPEDVLCVPCLFSDVLDGYGLWYRRRLPVAHVAWWTTTVILVFFVDIPLDICSFACHWKGKNA